MRFTIHLVSRGRLLAAGPRDPRRAPRAVGAGHQGHEPLDEPAAKLRAALEDGPLRRKEIEALIGKDGDAGHRRVGRPGPRPAAGTWEQRRADNFGLAEDWLPQPEVRGRRSGTWSRAI